jgi:hypothetical protein
LNQTAIQDIGDCKNTDYLVKLADYNTALLSKPVYFVYGTSTIFVALFAYDVYIMTRPIINRPIITDIEEIRERCDSGGSETNPMVTINKIEVYSQILVKPRWYNQVGHYFAHSKFVNEFNKTIKFLGIIGIFEYFFFVLVINQYHLTTPKILECYVLNKVGL